MKIAPTFVVVALIAVACGASQGSNASSTAGSATKTITIGNLAMSTGAGAAQNTDWQNGLKLAIDQANSQGYLKQWDTKLVVESQETASDPTTAVTTFQEFANRKVPVVTLGALSTIAQPLDPIATSTQTVLIGNVTVGTPAEDYEFRIVDTVTPFVEYGTQLAQRKFKRVAALINGDNPAFAKLVGNLSIGLQQGGGAIVGTQKVSSTTTDYSAALTNILTLRPDAIFLGLLDEQAGNAAIQIRATAGLATVQLAAISSVSPLLSKIAGKAATGMLLNPGFVPGNPAFATFNQGYAKASGGRVPTVTSALGYQAGWLIAIAVKQALAAGQSVTGSSLRQQIPSASQSADMKKISLVNEFSIAASGDAHFGDLLAEFNSSGAIVPAPKS